MREPPIRKLRSGTSARGPQRPAPLVRAPAPPGRLLEHGPIEGRQPREPVTALPAFPHGDEIGRRLGRRFTESAALDPEGCARAGVPAFTVAGRSHFAAANPPLNIAAHEAAHVLQQAGATRDLGLGAEGHAAAIEHKVAMGEEAGDLIGPHGRPVGLARLSYTFVGKSQQKSKKWNAKRHLRVSDDGHMAVATGDSNHYFWAEKGMMAESNQVLAKAMSRIQLKAAGDELSGPAPDGSGPRTLTRVEPFDKLAKQGGDQMELWADCDRAAFAVMGTKGASPGSVNGPLVGGIYQTPALPGAEMMTGSASPQKMRDEILAQQPGLDSLDDYKKLKPKEREKIDAQAGINKYATPQTGEAYTTAGDLSPTEKHWIYHWGAVVMTSGSDRVTLENFSISDRKAKNTDWSFEMYGSAEKPGQTFHEQQVETGHHGDVPVTIGVRNRP